MLACVISAILGAAIAVLAKAHIDSIQNLTKEQYTQCVQMVVNDLDCGYDKTSVINEIQQYAMDETTEILRLSRVAQDIINKVKNQTKHGIL